MTPPTPLPTPSFGDTLPIEASPETLAFLARRRSASAMTLAAPAPSDSELTTILTVAARAPDHGKLSPWRFIVLSGEAKSSFVDHLETIASTRPDAVKAQAKLGKIRLPPLTVAVVSRFIAGDIPEWEQRLSAGSVCMLMIMAAQAMGYGANWITDWYAYDANARRLLGLADNELIAGFVHIGTVGESPMERVRPSMESIVETWNGPHRPT